MCSYLDQHHPGCELIVVLDGCTDNTAGEARAACQGSLCQVKIIELPVNQGKGAAVRTGILAASGQYLFFTDADLSYAPETIEQFHARLKEGADVVIAQRQKNTTYPGIARKLLAAGSRFLVGNIILPGIRDTQAGFKGFTRQAALYLFRRQRTSRFLFDLEILVIARNKGFRIDKVYVDWQDRPGSTVRVIADTARSLRDLFLICFFRLSGAYERET